MGGGDPIWRSLPVPAFVIGADGCTIAANPAAQEFMNLSARALIGQPLLARLKGDAPLSALFERIGAGHTTAQLSDVSVTVAGRAPVLCTLHAGPVAEQPDRVILLILPREHADLLVREPGLTPSARSAIGMADMLAHEIKNPLAGISGAAQLLAMNLAPPDQELTDLIVEETRRIVKLLEQVEQFGHMRPPDCQPVNIHDVIDRARRSAGLGFAARLRFAEAFDPSLPMVMADADQLTQVLLNLFKNAAEAAGPDGGTLLIRTYYDQGLRVVRDGQARALPVQIEVIDDGPGIPEAVRDNIFDPFISGRENGTGLGLALVSRIIAGHEGRVAVESQPGRTVFRLSLPVAAAQP